MIKLPRAFFEARTIRRRAFWPVLAAVALLAAGTGTALREMTTRQVQERLTARGEIVGHMVANAVEVEHDDAGHLSRVVSALGAEPQVDLVVVIADDPLRVVSSTRREYLGHSLDVLEDRALASRIRVVLRAHRESTFALQGGDRVACVMPTLHDDTARGPRRGAVVVVVNGSAIRAQSEAWQRQLVILLIALLAGALLSAELILRRYVLQPVQAMTDAVDRRRAGDRTARIPVLADDELGRLAIALREANVEVNSALHDLEFQKYALDQAATVLITDAEGRILYVNDAYCRLSGYAREELLGANPRIVNSGHHPDAFFRDLHERLSSGRIWRGEICNRAKGGGLYWVHSTIIPSLDGAGRPDRFTAVLFDITERKQAELAVQVNEARTHQIIDSALDAVVAIDARGNITEWNRQAEAVFGWSAGEVTGRSLAETIIPLQFRAAHRHGLARHQRTGQSNVLGQRIEISALRRDGSEFPVELSISTVDVGGEVIFSAFIRDISERKRVESELVQAKDAAQSANRAKSEFLATMSHEIRTPMNGVIGFTDLLIDTPLDATQREFAETIRSSGQALLGLINDILDFSKIEAGKLDIERAPFDARDVVGEVVELLAARADERGLEVVLDWPEEVPRQLVGDALRFRQVLVNLAGNAVKFTSSGSVQVRVARESESLVRVQVTDTGIGVSEEKIVQLFRKFTQADSSTTRRFGGTGLGLAISKQLVDLMGGQIGAESVPGRGSTFWFTMPLATGAVAPAPTTAERRPLRVLVVDDLAASRAVLLAGLASQVAEVTGAASAGDATELLRAAAADGRAFDAVFIDSGLPGTDGETLACAITADPGAGDPAMVLLVPGSRRTDAGALRSGRFADVIVKPIVHPDVLATALARVADAGRRSGAGPTPLSAAPRPAPVAVPVPAPADAGATAAEGCRVLLAEDQPVNQKLAVRVLMRLGCRVDVAHNGIEAHSLATTNDYAMVFMDCHMPEMDGYEATAAIRADEETGLAGHPRRRRTPIVALTASVLKADRDRCFASGMDDFISKPFRADQIESALRRWTGGEGGSEGTLREAA